MKGDDQINLITHMQRFSISDGPGIRTTVFIKGCHLRCKWCHNPECLDFDPEIYFREEKCVKCGRCLEVCPENAIPLEGEERINRTKCTRCMECVKACRYGALTQVGEPLSIEEVIEEASKDSLFYRNSGGGVTISGGEPLANFEFVYELSRKMKEEGLHVALDTSGFVEWKYLKRMMEYIDLVLYDLKHLDPLKHKEATGADNRLILGNFKLFTSNYESKVRTRIPVIPGFNASQEEMESIASFISRTNSIDGVDLLPYHDYAKAKYIMLGKKWLLPKIDSLSQEQVEPFKKIFESYGIKTTIGG